MGKHRDEKNKKFLLISTGLLLTHLFLLEQRKKPVKVNYVDQVPFKQNAITLPPFGIYIHNSQQQNAELLRHELVHWNQYKRLGFLGYYLGLPGGSPQVRL